MIFKGVNNNLMRRNIGVLCLLVGLSVNSGACGGAPDSGPVDCTEEIQAQVSGELALWYSNRDGAMHFYQIPILFEMGKSAPGIFYSMMSADSLAFESFLGSLDFSVFNNPFGADDSTTRANRLQSSIDAIEMQEIPQAYEKLRVRLVQSLNLITIVVDE